MGNRLTAEYSRRLIARLVADGHVELAEGSTEADAVDAIVAALDASPQHAGLVGTTSRALLASEHVAELYLDDDALQDLVNSLGQG